ncbi:hypothetical protein HYH03_013548 [Edaphochlamys debaryana]|uniref:Ammonium transporter n=1 Tax=Edaphochlamys debaryana TaxID=47281 RepID=A0A835XPU4_9CHLO|nr:hypothetical protein HYH03_013548 [Edaphochlamys debaryana]|eukprot:KAG2487831.1 hypothetical protein HYH03_013548 [Edaphochlamys debaryana]
MALAGCSVEQAAQVLALTGGDTAAAGAICSGGDVGALGAAGAVTKWTVGQLRTAQEDLAAVQTGLDTAFVLSSAYQVFMMQLGFALFAAGVVRPKNTVAIFLKNLFDTCIAGVAFYLLGYSFAFGALEPTNGFIGYGDFALSATTSGPPPNPWHLFVWNWSFCSAATTILSGSIAERGTFVGYTLYAVFMPAWVYPVVVHWLWSPNGWLSAKNAEDRILGVGAIDYAGSGVVHLMGGMAALVGSAFVGPRVGRFATAGSAGTGEASSQLYRATAAPHLYLMGTLILWFGWFGFNPASRLTISDAVSATIVGRTAVTTTLSGCCGALAGLGFTYWRHRVWDLLSTCIGALAGMVAVTSGCSVIEPWAAIICGSLAPLWYEAGEALLERLKIDDPVSAFPLHACCGVWGLLFTGLLASENYITQVYNITPGHNRMGLFYGGHAQLLLCQFIAVCVIAGWSAFNMTVLFGGLHFSGLLRVGAEKEAAGMDLASCGQYNAPGAVNIHSSKVSTKADTVLAAISMDRRANGGPGMDYSLRPSASGQLSSHHTTASVTAAVSPLGPSPPSGVGAGPGAGVGALQLPARPSSSPEVGPTPTGAGAGAGALVANGSGVQAAMGGGAASGPGAVGPGGAPMHARVAAMMAEATVGQPALSSSAP